MNLKSIKPKVLGDAQRLLTHLIPRLFDYAHSKGYEMTLGDGFRDPRVFGEIGERLGYGHARSSHKKRLALDINLFKNGVYLNKTEDHKELGEWWEKQHELCRWGGRFEDGNHYSLEWDGVM